MRSYLLPMLLVLLLSGVSRAKEPLPDAPSVVLTESNFIVVEPSSPVTPVTPLLRPTETRIVDRTFVSFALVSTASTFADSYTTLFARQNWLAGKKGVCNMEVQSAYLYGTHPTVARAYAVASAKTVTSVLAAYYLRKHHNKFWSLPLIANSVMSLEGVTQNMSSCN